MAKISRLGVEFRFFRINLLCTSISYSDIFKFLDPTTWKLAPNNNIRVQEWLPWFTSVCYSMLEAWFQAIVIPSGLKYAELFWGKIPLPSSPVKLRDRVYSCWHIFTSMNFLSFYLLSLPGSWRKEGRKGKTQQQLQLSLLHVFAALLFLQPKLRLTWILVCGLISPLFKRLREW